MKTGQAINTILKNLGAEDTATSFVASATPPASGVTTYCLSNVSTSYPTEVLAWLDGTTIKYYAQGYTDSTTRIPLNANSSSMFKDCKNLTSIDVNGFDTSKVTQMYYMFEDCWNLTSLDVSGFNTSKVTNMAYMFAWCMNLTSLDVSGFDTSKVTSMLGMFRACTVTTGLDVSSFNTSNVTDMEQMFYDCSVTSLDLSGFDTSKVTNMNSMFFRCRMTSLNLNGFDTSNVTDMEDMFSACDFTILDLSSFDTHNVTTMRGMFSQSSDLETIFASTSFVTDNLAPSGGGGMFHQCYALKGGNQTDYSSGGVSSNYARIDDPANGNPGYFTLKTNP